MKITETISSPNCSSRGNHIPRLIVCHIADGTYEGTKAWFKQNASQTSSHYIVAQDGRVCQCVSLEKMAWCNGTGTGNKSPSYSTVALVRKFGGNANQYSISIECEGYYNKTKGAITDAQLDALIELIKGIQTEIKRIYGFTIPFDREHIVGHYEITPKTRPHCPGEKFPWDELIKRLNGEQIVENNIKKENAPVAKPNTSVSTGTPSSFTPYKVKVTTDYLNIRNGAGTNYGVNGVIKDSGVYTIVAESYGQGATKWLKLKSGAGWIANNYTMKI